MTDTNAMDNEIGTTNRPPRLTNADDFDNWKFIYENFSKYKDSSIWKSIEKGSQVPMVRNEKNEFVPMDPDLCVGEEILQKEKDEKAYAGLTMALSTEIAQGFKEYKTAKALWDALVERFEGNLDMRESRKDMLRQKFNMFKYVNGESLESQINRFTHLMNEISGAGIEMTKGEINKKLLNSLPINWNFNITTIKRTKDIYTTSLSELISILRSYEMDDQQRQIMFMSETDHLVSPGSALLSTTAASVQQNSSPSSNTVKAVETNVALFSVFLNSYNALLAGKLSHANLVQDDMEQIHPDDLEEMDIKWHMVMAVHRAKKFIKRTGRNSFDGMKFGAKKNDWGDQIHELTMKVSNHALMVKIEDTEEITQLRYANAEHKRYENIFKDKIEANKNDFPKLEMDFRNKECLYRDALKRIDDPSLKLNDAVTQLANTKLTIEKIDHSRSVVYDMLDSQVRKKGNPGIGYHVVEHAFNGNFTSMPSVQHEDVEMEYGVGRKPDQPSSSTQSTPVSGGSSVKHVNVTNPSKFCVATELVEGIVEDCRSDDEEESRVFKSKSVSFKNTLSGFQNSATCVDSGLNICLENGYFTSSPQWSSSWDTGYYAPYPRRQTCYVCGNPGHLARNCVHNCEHSGRYPNVSQWENVYQRPYTSKRYMAQNHNRPNDKQLDKSTSGQPRRPINNLWYVDSGCSRHMTGDISQLHDIKMFNGGYVSFAGDKGGKITMKGTVTNGTLYFEDVKYVSELNHSLLSVSQIYDKMFSTHFTNKECLILKPGFVVPEDWILMCTPRCKDSYLLDMNSESSLPNTCLFSKASKNDSMLWHRRLGHINLKNLNKIAKGAHVVGLPLKEFCEVEKCISCAKGKQHNGHTNPSCSIRSSLFFNCFIWICLVLKKSETVDILRQLMILVENQLNLKIKIIRSDNGTEFRNEILDSFCVEKGIARQFSAARTPHQNGFAERRNRVLSVSITAHPGWGRKIRNVINQKPKIGHFRAFGCICTLLHNDTIGSKFDAKADECYFVGYSSSKTAYRVYNKRTKQIVASYYIDWHELNKTDADSGLNWLFDYDYVFKLFNVFSDVSDMSDDGFYKYSTVDYRIDEDPDQGSSSSSRTPESSSQESDHQIADPVNNEIAASSSGNASQEIVASGSGHASQDTIPDPHVIEEPVPITEEADQYITNLPETMQQEEVPTLRIHKDHPVEDIIGPLSDVVKTRSQSGTINVCLYSAFISQIEPKNIKMALSEASWVKAMQEELMQFEKLKDDSGVIVRNKAILVVQGFYQQEGIDYEEVFSPVAHLEAIRIFLAYASYKNFKVFQMDVKTTFLYGKIKEEVCVCQPPGFEETNHPHHVYKLDKDMYGLHQAPRAWYATLTEHLLANGYSRGTIDQTLFLKIMGDDLILVQIYVDDIIFGSTNDALCKEFEEVMKMNSMGEMAFFLGLQVKQSDDGNLIHQAKYFNDILLKFNFSDSKPASTPMATRPVLTTYLGELGIDQHIYRSMIGSLIYLTANRPDIMFAVCQCARYQANPKLSHLNAVKRIFKYLKGKYRLGLWYPKDSEFNFFAFTDSDHGGCNLDRKSTTGGCQFLGERLVSWQCKKQTTVSTSTPEAEYVAASACCSQVIRMQHQLLDYGLNFFDSPIFCDNEAALKIVKNPIKHSKTKQIDIRVHHIRDCFERKLMHLEPELMRIGLSAASTLDAAYRQIISSFGWLHLAADLQLCS
ncbi:hypothetical protein L1987_57771 [Smallanthus sonchifolius]|uniref:Uncharacterized protein n=1 Tax=Smallanthus sonchifolius TaxID=185202 RepID=A0ACB9DDM6_9ASTR|nr:hypothetical protein L1987_57771 [Smallanthus sonchifolius]